MSAVTPNVTSQGGSIHLNYSPGSEKGISNPVTLGLQLAVEPEDDSPFALVTLSLGTGGFSFNNNSATLVKDLGIITNGDSVNLQFKVIFDTTNPPDLMEMTVSARDKFDDPTPDVFITYSVKKDMTSEGNFKLLFLS